MREKPKFTLNTFLSCLILNGVLVAGLYLLAREHFVGLHSGVDQLLGAGAQNLSEGTSLPLSKLSDFIRGQERYLVPLLFGSGGLVTLILWLVVQFQGRRLINRILSFPGFPSLSPEEQPREGTKGTSKKAEGPPKRMQAPPPSPLPAVQILAALQREGRFIDFLQEDLSTYEDAQIGAAVRNIHQGCKKALSDHLELKPVFEQEEEGTDVTIKPGFDAEAICLTGNVTGDPPFRGSVRHRGWQVVRVDLPQKSPDQGKEKLILAPAEVEIDG